MFTRSIFFTNMQIEITKWAVTVLLIAAVSTAATARELIENQSFTFNVQIQMRPNLDTPPSDEFRWSWLEYRRGKTTYSLNK